MRRPAFAVLGLLAACTVGPDYKSPAAPAASGYTPAPLPAQTASADDRVGAAQRFVADMDIPGQWWTLFHSENLNRRAHPVDYAPATGTRPDRLPGVVECPADLPANVADLGAGAGPPPGRHGRLVSGARWGVVEPNRCRCCWRYNACEMTRCRRRVSTATSCGGTWRAGTCAAALIITPAARPQPAPPAPAAPSPAAPPPRETPCRVAKSPPPRCTTRHTPSA